MKEGRLNFSDYSVEEQERDARKHKAIHAPREVYIMKISGVWSAYVPNNPYPITISGDFGEEIAEFYSNIKNILEKQFKMEVKIKHISNAGVEEYLRKQIEIHKLYSTKAYKNEY